MKSRRIITTLLTTISLATLLGTTSITVNAASNRTNKTVATKHVKNKDYFVFKKRPKLIIKNMPRLSKLGYVINVNSSAQPIYVGKSNYKKLLNDPLFKGTKTIDPKKIEHVRFKVTKVMFFDDVSGSPLYFVTSKDHKYNGWTPNAGLQYYAINSKPFQRVIKPLKRIGERGLKGKHLKVNSKGMITDRKWLAQNEHDFALAVKAAKRLKGNQRKFALGSLMQMKRDGSVRNVMIKELDNALLWGI
ncbi:hypothetical protein [Lactobacillus ultunensis]|uniref:hypothetical protein n=1 Tax=Lactobacillus ultunensis TaxID=227945 RepID=UPI0019113EE0|nr:hypothetical protein [Lactobacillus ultunensis]QQP29475.1 hypothetical protein H4B44_05355 [Lactobacillus ultunensis]